jgi:hypothetical protein
MRSGQVSLERIGQGRGIARRTDEVWIGFAFLGKFPESDGAVMGKGNIDQVQIYCKAECHEIVDALRCLDILHRYQRLFSKGYIGE